MRRIAICSCAVLLLGCGKKQEPAMDQSAAPPASDTAATAATPAAPAPISLAELAGKWKMRTMAEGSDSTLAEYTLDADSTGKWTLHFPKHPPVVNHATAGGDSIVADAGPYESVLRKGVKVTTHAVLRLQDGKLVGTVVGHYAVKTADSVSDLRTEGTREK